MKILFFVCAVAAASSQAQLCDRQLSGIWSAVTLESQPLTRLIGKVVSIQDIGTIVYKANQNQDTNSRALLWNRDEADDIAGTIELVGVGGIRT